MTSKRPTTKRGRITQLIDVVTASIVGGPLASACVPSRLRMAVYKLLGFDISLHGRIGPGVRLTSRDLHLGSGSTINDGCFIDCRGGVRIGIGPRVNILTSTHDYADPSCRAGRGKSAPVAIEDGCWLGASVTVLPGVTIGHGCVIAAGSVVTTDCLPDTLQGGTPARVIRNLGSAGR